MTSLWLRFGYRPWARFLHRLNLHHTRTIGPLWPDGDYVQKCDWCGISRTIGRQFSACVVRLRRLEQTGDAR